MLWQVKMDPIFLLNPDMCQLEFGLVPVKTTGLFFHLDCDHYPGFQIHHLGPMHANILHAYMLQASFQQYTEYTGQQMLSTPLLPHLTNIIFEI